jgi:hypothetical protein
LGIVWIEKKNLKLKSELTSQELYKPVTLVMFIVMYIMVIVVIFIDIKATCF